MKQQKQIFKPAEQDVASCYVLRRQAVMQIL